MELYLREKDGSIKKNVRLFKNKSYEELSEIIKGCNNGDEIVVYTDEVKEKKEIGLDGCWYLYSTVTAQNKTTFYFLYVNKIGFLTIPFKSEINELIDFLYKRVKSGTKIKYLKETETRVYQILVNDTKKFIRKRYTGTYYDYVETKSLGLYTAIKLAGSLAKENRGNKYSVVTRYGKVLFEAGEKYTPKIYN